MEKSPISWGLCPQAVGEPVDRGWRSVVVVVDDGLLPYRDGSSEGDRHEEENDGEDDKELADGVDPTGLVHHADHDGDAVGSDGQNDHGKEVA